MPRSTPLAIVAAVVFVAALVPQAHAERSKSEIVRSLSDRYKTLYGLISSHKVGETHKGLAEAVDSKFLGEKIKVGTKTLTVRQILDAENKDRRALYAIIAREQRVSPDVVAAQNGARKRSTLKKGQYFRGKDGKWTRIGQKSGK